MNKDKFQEFAERVGHFDPESAMLAGSPAEAAALGTNSIDRGPRLPHQLPASHDVPDEHGHVQVYNIRNDSHIDGDLCTCDSELYDNTATAAAIVHRVNGWDALCDRVEAAEAVHVALCEGLWALLSRHGDTRGGDVLSAVVRHVDEERAEAERSKKAYAAKHAEHMRTRANRNRAEAERVRQVLYVGVEKAKLKKAEAEVERLRASTVELHRDLRAEVERLRADLRVADAAIAADWRNHIAVLVTDGINPNDVIPGEVMRAIGRHVEREQIGNTAPDTQEKT